MTKNFLILFSIFNIIIFSQENEEKKINSFLIADSFINLHPDTIAYPTEAKSYRWNYEQGLMLEAFFQMWRRSGEDKYFDYLKKNIDYYIEEDGTIKTYKLSDYNIDNVSPGRVLIRLYRELGEEKYIKAADTLIKQLENHPRTTEGGFWHKKVYPYQMWLDGLFMAQPFYAYYGLLNNNEKIFDDGLLQFRLINKYLKDEKTGLYFHGWDEKKEQVWADKETGLSPNFWGRSIGWFMMAIVDVLDFFPNDHEGRDELILTLQNLSESLLIVQDEQTKLWYQVLDQGNREGNYIEASASAMFIYAFAKGYNKKYLDKRFYKIASESFKSLLKNLVVTDENGNLFLTNVCSVAGLGGKDNRDGSFEYYISEPKRDNDFKGYGPFLLAAIEIERGR